LVRRLTCQDRVSSRSKLTKQSNCGRKTLKQRRKRIPSLIGNRKQRDKMNFQFGKRGVQTHGTAFERVLHARRKAFFWLSRRSFPSHVVREQISEAASKERTKRRGRAHVVGQGSRMSISVIFVFSSFFLPFFFFFLAPCVGDWRLEVAPWLDADHCFAFYLF
jgi:hypothetical protein